MIRTLVIGHGFSAQTFHVPFLLASPFFHWTGSVSSKPDAIHVEHPTVQVFKSIDQVPVSQFDMAIVTTPNALHYEQVEQLLNMGLHVVVEKPMVLTVSQAVMLFNLAEQQGKTLTVFQNRRWDGDFLTVKSLLQSDSLGHVGRYVSRFDRFRPVVRKRWRESSEAGAGILWDLGPHLLDQMVALFGRPESITANVSRLRPGSLADDTFELWCHYPNLEVVLGSSCYQAGPNLRFNIEGDQGSFIKYGLDVQEDALKAGVDVATKQWGVEAQSQWGLLHLENSSESVPSEAGHYHEFWNKLASTINKDDVSPVPKADVLTVIELIELAYQSAKEQRTLSLT